MIQTKMPELLVEDNVRNGLCAVGGVFAPIYVADLGFCLGGAAVVMGLKRVLEDFFFYGEMALCGRRY